MSDLHDLIRACKAEPDDDAPRLVLADYLEERGEAAHAKLIRRQVQEPDAVEEGATFEAPWLRYWQCLEELIKPRPSDPDGNYTCVFHRGFLRISDCFRELYDHLGTILNPVYDWTWLEEISFGSWRDGDWTPLLQSPQLLELNRLLFIADHDRPVLVEPLAASLHVGNLKYLCLKLVIVGDDGAERLSQSARLSGLQSLDLLCAHIGLAGARALARSEAWNDLRSCSLRLNPLGDEGIAELGAGRRRPELMRLDVAHCANTDEGLLALARSDRFPNLRELCIGYSDFSRGRTAFGRTGPEAILTSPNFQRTVVRIHYVGDVVAPELESLGREYPGRLVIDHGGPPRP